MGIPAPRGGHPLRFGCQAFIQRPQAAAGFGSQRFGLPQFGLVQHPAGGHKGRPLCRHGRPVPRQKGGAGWRPLFCMAAK